MSQATFTRIVAGILLVILFTAFFNYIEVRIY